MSIWCISCYSGTKYNRCAAYRNKNCLFTAHRSLQGVKVHVSDASHQVFVLYDQHCTLALVELLIFSRTAFLYALKKQKSYVGRPRMYIWATAVITNLVILVGFICQLPIFTNPTKPPWVYLLIITQWTILNICIFGQDQLFCELPANVCTHWGVLVASMSIKYTWYPISWIFRQIWP